MRSIRRARRPLVALVVLVLLLVIGYVVHAGSDDHHVHRPAPGTSGVSAHRSGG